MNAYTPITIEAVAAAFRARPSLDLTGRKTPKLLGTTQKALKEEIGRQAAISGARRAAREITPQAQMMRKLEQRLHAVAVAACAAADSGDQFINIENATIIDRDRAKRVWLLKDSGWCKYSRRQTWHREACWLAGHDPDQPSGYFCIRVPGKLEKVWQALDWIEPKEVQAARLGGRQILRQGDVYLIQQRRDNLRHLPRNHRWDAETRILSHPEHGPLTVDFPVKAVPQKFL